MNIKNLLMCPKCKGELDHNCRCTSCGAAYETKMGIYNVLFEDIGEEYHFSNWEINEDELEKTIKNYDNFQKEYRSHISQECIDAEAKLDEVIRNFIEKCSGTILDIATGRGMLLEKVMKWNPKLKIIGSDIDARILAVTKRIRNCGDNVAFLGTDARHIALKDESVNHVVSFAGIANMPETGKVIGEICRILKPDGTFIYKGTFLDRGSEGYEDIRNRFHLEHVMDIELLTEMFLQTGFKLIRSEIIATGIWQENPYDGYPFAGENNNYGIIVVQK